METYVIARPSFKTGICFMVDRRIRKDKFWSYGLKNALKLNDFDYALGLAREHNNKSKKRLFVLTIQQAEEYARRFEK